MNSTPYRFGLLSIVLSLLLLAPQALAFNNPADNKADPELLKQDKAVVFGERAAHAWLALVDQGQYAQSWKQAAPFFQRAVSQKDWVKGIKAARAPFGSVKKREVIAADYATKISGAPAGEYVILQYLSSFSNKQSAVETITPMRCKDGVWRVSGYYIR